ncbi:Uncharacterised protein [Mycobacteroides abscessus subsp. massiliense]|uniref:hypothetical protein n=1 Tax=Mycobacteroides abscessus TaxID=36809 RepID=UPI0009A62D96|nr:hypothetical protein [Mycobacteroides abscessus]SLC05104.1 Uncharacterised protein [Mycobacteroides abscessus subsp. massiliense]
MTTFSTEIELGQKYRDIATGFEGTASAVYFFQHGCERVNLKGLNGQGELVEYVFDAPELEHQASGLKVELLEKKTGGPHDRTPVARH